MKEIIISGTRLWNPKGTLTNEALVSSYHAIAGQYNLKHEEGMESGMAPAKVYSSAEFILKGSEIQRG